MSKSVRYSQDLRDRAKREKRFLITVSVDGRELGDGSCTIQRIADLKMARRVVKYAIALMKSGRTGGEPKEGQ